MTSQVLPPPPVDQGSAALRDAAALLWPAPATAQLVRRRGLVRRRAPVPGGRTVIGEFLLFPSAEQPRLVVPARARRAGAVIARGRGQFGRWARLRPFAGGLLVRSGLADALARDRLRLSLPDGATRDDVEHLLGTLLRVPVVVGLSIGAPRVNRKPILHVVDRNGRTLAFVKVGHNAETRELVQREATVLRELAAQSPASIQLPHVLHHATWHDLDVLVLSPVGDGRQPRIGSAPPFDAMRELAAVHEVQTKTLTESGYAAALRAATAGLDDGTAAQRHAAALERIEHAAGDIALRFGAWHGDWTLWNMSTDPNTGRIALWDWERFATGVPVGFDAVHFQLQTLLQQHAATLTAEDGFLAVADEAAIAGGAAPDSARVVTALYLAELAVRYLTLVESPHGQPLERRARWVLPYLETVTARL